MLKKEEYKYNFKLIYFISKLNLIPVHLDRKTWKLAPEKSYFRRLIFTLIIWYCILRSGFVYLRILYTLFWSHETVKDLHLSIYIAYTLGSFITLLLGYNTFVVHQDVNAMIFNEFFPPSDMKVRPPKEIWQYSIQDLWTMVAIACFYPFVFVAAGIFALNPNFRILMYSLIVPDWSWDPLTFYSLLVEEILVMIVWMSFGVYYEIFLIPAFERMTQISEDIIDKCERPRLATTFENHMKALKSLHLLAVLFNKGNRASLFYLKNFCSTTCIVMTFFGIKTIRDNILVGAFNFLSAVAMIIAYTVSFQKAYLIPERIGQCKELLLTEFSQETYRRRNDLASGYIERMVASVPQVQIQWGIFRTFNRISTLSFIAFVTESLANLLIAFQ